MANRNNFYHGEDAPPKPRINTFTKSAATIEDQISKLRERGCVIGNEEKAHQVLESVNYYRIAYYFSVFLESKGRYRPGTTFEHVVKIYDFDRRLRNLCLEYLEEIEIALRAYISNFHGLKYGAVGYLNSGSFDHHHNHKSFLTKIDRMVESNMDQEMVLHYVKKYNGSFPVWSIMELFSFGTLNSFFLDMKPTDQNEIAQKYFGVSPRVLENWLHCLSDLRNHCAHYHRLYGTHFNSIPRDIPDSDYKMTDMLFDYLLIIRQMYPRPEMWNDGFMRQLGRLFYDYINETELELIGFPQNWMELLEVSL